MIKQAMKSHDVLTTAESQGRVEVQEALEFQTSLANGTFLESSAEKETRKTMDDKFDDRTTLVLGEQDQDP